MNNIICLYDTGGHPSFINMNEVAYIDAHPAEGIMLDVVQVDIQFTNKEITKTLKINNKSYAELLKLIE